MSESKMVFIGGGNMAEALLHGILEAGMAQPAQTVVTDVRKERLQELENRFGIQTTLDNREALQGASVVWLCVKPQQMEEVIQPLAGVAPEALFISIAAGVPTQKLETGLGEGVRVVRVMPNTPALVGKGAAGIAPGAHASEADVEQVRSLMDCVGTTVVVDEETLHAVTALSGSGPAYVFYLVESMLAAAEQLGMDPEQARTLAVQTVCGAGELLQSSGQPPSELRRRVTSKGGTTAAALDSFRNDGVGESLTRGVLAAALRSRELADG